MGQKTDLVGGWTNPFEKYESNWIISPSRDKNKKYLNPPPSGFWADLVTFDPPVFDFEVLSATCLISQLARFVWPWVPGNLLEIWFDGGVRPWFQGKLADFPRKK